MNLMKLQDYTRRGVLLIGAFLTVALFSYTMYKISPFLSLQKKRIEEENFKTNLLNIRRGIRQYISRYGDIYFLDPEDGSRTKLDYDTSSKNIDFVMNAYLREGGKALFNDNGTVSSRVRGGFLKQYSGKILNERNMKVTENLVQNSSFENVYYDEDVKNPDGTNKLLVDGWDSFDGVGKSRIVMSNESPSGSKEEAYREGSYGTKTVIIENYR